MESGIVGYPQPLGGFVNGNKAVQRIGDRFAPDFLIIMGIFHYRAAANHEQPAAILAAEALFATFVTKPDNGTSATTRTMFRLFPLRGSTAFAILELLYILQNPRLFFCGKALAFLTNHFVVRHTLPSLYWYYNTLLRG